ncbi:hypothetical protein LF1_08130 [Rubripirellula obstinata]|uniref:Uncharacterized protein n=2 Tax=Rubripirellula obstinata TaxID=406547 RepID=A0A5B1CB30_9BACT|nr:hypothetical protein [Rubripirellula obstinata]KAA1258297.1 hypothetical protein LF1_08130 [Rubripirellula obstinata]
MPMTDAQKARAEALRPLFRNMDQHKAQEMRQAYYRIAENLRPLVDALEMADYDDGALAGPLLEEHYIFCEMLDTIKQSALGEVL